jgi:hypothetical protein
MMHVECPWCAGAATVEVAGGGEFSCTDCSIAVELVPEQLSEPVAVAA